VLTLKFIDVFGTVVGDIDAQLAHDGDCFGTNVARVGSGAEDVELMTRVVA